VDEADKHASDLCVTERPPAAVRSGKVTDCTRLNPGILWPVPEQRKSIDGTPYRIA
jgi:hypothetical protein